MRILLVLFYSCISTFCFSQSSYATDIDNQVWKPFAKAIMTQDVGSFIELHSKDLMRVEVDNKRLLNYDAYKTNMESNWPNWADYNKKNSVRYIFELRFLQRISNPTQAFETGYFKNETINANGEKNVSYGQFQVALRKEGKVWKILVDSDTSLNGSITEDMFQSAKPIE